MSETLPFLFRKSFYWGRPSRRLASLRLAHERPRHRRCGGWTLHQRCLDDRSCKGMGGSWKRYGGMLNLQARAGEWYGIARRQASSARLDGWLDSWHVGWLDGWQVGWLDGWQVGWLAGWMVKERRGKNIYIHILLCLTTKSTDVCQRCLVFGVWWLGGQ